MARQYIINITSKKIIDTSISLRSSFKKPIIFKIVIKYNILAPESWICKCETVLPSDIGDKIKKIKQSERNSQIPMFCFILEADGCLVYVILRDAQLKEFWRNYKTLLKT